MLFYAVPEITKKLKPLWTQILEWLNGRSRILGIEYAAA